ncbi:Glucosamine/galactosamine-6-phosphate isomerase [Ascoidea rubescens DSM 1968]|uniref:glucosamine-6-phosphate deaminase n=1 Tax=Ascoidea rubescens DSM 1968 TaxID=1344418 RepID=A0A1D2VHB6_9ASCO|nr:Glucosamine/galactosamine-6-phosphate isomerase [Ascoidea rubescens DSM 1968]ODV61015.1 Glucosamine/galactosamine-6-phosphate isomerase [Ascoidea rubescens DSM 1968]
MKINVYEDKEKASAEAALYIVQRINKFKPTKKRPFVLGLTAGSLLDDVYKNLVKLYQYGKVSFENVVTFNTDEYCIKKYHPNSNYSYMYHKFFNHVNIPKGNINLLYPDPNYYNVECEKYGKKVNQKRINLVLTVLGNDGELAFNDSGSTIYSKTRKVKLSKSIIEENSKLWNYDLKKVPVYGLTVGISTFVENTDEVLMFSFGEKKNMALKQVVKGKISPNYPSTYLQHHRKCTIYADFDSILENEFKINPRL